MPAHIFRIGQNKVEADMGDTLQYNKADNHHQDPHREQCNHIQQEQHTTVDNPGIEPHLTTLRRITKLAR
jgi:hypothetical protein